MEVLGLGRGSRGSTTLLDLCKLSVPRRSIMEVSVYDAVIPWIQHKRDHASDLPAHWLVTGLFLKTPDPVNIQISCDSHVVLYIPTKPTRCLKNSLFVTVLGMARRYAQDRPRHPLGQVYEDFYVPAEVTRNNWAGQRNRFQRATLESLLHAQTGSVAHAFHLVNLSMYMAHKVLEIVPDYLEPKDFLTIEEQSQLNLFTHLPVAEHVQTVGNLMEDVFHNRFVFRRPRKRTIQRRVDLGALAPLLDPSQDEMMLLEPITKIIDGM